MPSKPLRSKSLIMPAAEVTVRSKSLIRHAFGDTVRTLCARNPCSGMPSKPLCPQIHSSNMIRRRCALESTAQACFESTLHSKSPFEISVRNHCSHPLHSVPLHSVPRSTEHGCAPVHAICTSFKVSMRLRAQQEVSGYLSLNLAA